MTDASGFQRALNRLKASLRVPTDGEAAAMLGLSKGALCQRKGRNSFPAHELRDLAARRPDLGLDVDGILGDARFSRRRLPVRRSRAQQPKMDTHHPVLGFPLSPDVIADMDAHGETDYWAGNRRRIKARLDRARETALRMRITATARELAAARQSFLRGVLFGVQHGIAAELLKLARPSNKEQDSGEDLLGFDAGKALAGVLLMEHGKVIRSWLRRAAGQRGGRR